jgi:uncharacterized protein
MKEPKLSVKRYKHSDTSRFVVDGLRINGKRVRRFLATRQEADTFAIMQRYSAHVWIDSVWLPTISYTMAKRAYQEWLEVMPSNHLMWGADAHHVEGIYGATEFTRRCLAEALAEKVERGELREADALRIGQQVMRDNALELFPQLKDRLWKHKGKLKPPSK